MRFDPVQANQQLLGEIAVFCERTGMSPTALGEAALNDRAFVGGLKKGRQVLPKTLFRLRSFMEQKLGEQRAGAA